MKQNLAFEEAYADVLNDSRESRLDYLHKVYIENGGKPTKEGIIELLNIAVIDEWLAEFNYFASYNLSKTDGKNDFDPEFQQHETEEREHRYKLVNRLRELEAPVPVTLLDEFHAKNSNGMDWQQELDTNSGAILLRRLKEEEDAVKFYSMFLGYLNQDHTETKDSSTQRIIKEIKADEETHAKDLRDLAIERGLLK